MAASAQPTEPEADAEASGQPDAPQEPQDPATARARELFKQGVVHVKRVEWADALAAFEASARLKPHATTTFNVGACERALGNYTRALDAFRQALEQGKSHPGELAQSLREEARALSAQIDSLLVHVKVTLTPPTAAITVDGRPLRANGEEGGWPVLVAGVAKPGAARSAPGSRFVLVLDPGTHLITLTRKGYTDAIVNRSYAPGTRAELPLELARLPATLRISSNVPGSLVQVDDVDVGPAPVDVGRPAGNYRIRVTKQGYDPFEALVRVRAGELSSQRVTLKPESHSITSEWWFWTAAAGVVAGGVVVTYALTRPEPEPPPYDGGSTGWVARPAGFAF